MTEIVERKPLPIWQETPLRLKIKVVELLDFKSQGNLRQASRSDKDIVDNLERFFEHVTFVYQKIDGLFKYHERGFMTIKYSEGRAKEFASPCPWTSVADRFLSLCKNPRHTVGVLFIEPISIPRLVEAIQGRPVTPLKVMHLKIESKKKAEEELDESFFEFLKFIKPGATLKFKTGSITLGQLTKLYDMDQWKMSRGLDLLPDMDIPSLDKFHHFNSLRLRIQKMSVEDAKKLIQAFIDKPAGTYKNQTTFFRIFTKEFVDPAAILSSYDNELKPLTTMERENYYDQIRVQKFPMANSDYVFLVKAAGKFFTGMVCRENALEEDFGEVSYISNF